MLHAQHLSSPGDAALAAVSETSPNFSLRMSALSAALLRPQLKELPRRVERWNAIHDRIAAGLRRSQHIAVPRRDGPQRFSATSVQFSLVGLSEAEIDRVIASAADLGVPIKWFGAKLQRGFTSRPSHWRYIDPAPSVDRTEAVLAKLCDIRTPISLTDEDCDQIATIVLHAIETVVSGQPERRHDRARPGTSIERSTTEENA
jgi:dTDP-4-amino-4,6-dideoxygalactose transaminase